MEMEVDGSATNSNSKIDMDQIKAEDLFKAAENGDVSLLNNLSEEQLLKALSLRDEDSRSLLHVAVSFGRSEVSCLFICFFVLDCYNWTRINYKMQLRSSF